MRSFLKVWLGISFMAIGFGIVLLMIAFGTSGFSKAKETTSLHDTYEGVTSIKMDIDYREVEIVNGDRFSIDATGIIENEIESYVSDGIWHINEKNSKKIKIFGRRISVSSIFDWNDRDKIKITIPKDFVGREMDFRIKAGALSAEEIKAESCNLDVKTGRIAINRLSVSGPSNYHVGAGEIKVDQMDATDIDLSCEVGSIDVTGTILGDNSITNSVGNVKLNLNAESSDYSYEISCSVGEVTVGNNSYRNLSNRVINENNAKNKLKLDCSVGKITVKFN